ncbi:hypothetical protein Ancab_005999 [Ancistrocladus abbreviatus]
MSSLLWWIVIFFIMLSCAVLRKQWSVLLLDSNILQPSNWFIVEAFIALLAGYTHISWRTSSFSIYQVLLCLHGQLQFSAFYKIFSFHLVSLASVWHFCETWISFVFLGIHMQVDVSLSMMEN